MNQYSEFLEYIKYLADKDDLLNPITQDEPEKIDWGKSTLFPLLHVTILGGGFTNGRTVIFNVELVCINLREEVKEPNQDVYWRNDNEVDNKNTCLAILNRLWTSMYRDFEDRNINASENPQLVPITLDYTNVTDGWKLNFDVELPNNKLSLCP